MSHIMKTLGVSDAGEWAALAWQRPADEDEAAYAARQNASEQLLAMLSATGFVPDESFLADADLLVSGRMSYAEHRAYLTEKYKEHA